MGNTCCGGQRNIKSNQKTESLQNQLDNICRESKESEESEESVEFESLEEHKEHKERRKFRKKTSAINKDFSPEIAILERGVPVNVNIDDTCDSGKMIIEELEYSFSEYKSIAKENKKLFIDLFLTYKNSLPLGSAETISGFIYADIYENATKVERKGILISSFALYVLQANEFYNVLRRIQLDRLIIIILSADIKQMILHTSCTELLGDLWIKSDIIEEIYKCVQVGYNKLLKRYLPSTTIDNSLMEKTLNNLDFSMINLLLSKKYIKVSNVIISKGSVGENIITFKSTKGIINGILDDCIIVLTSHAIYQLNKKFKYKARLNLKDILSLIISKDFEKVIINQNNGENLEYLLDSKYIGSIQKAYTALLNKKLKVQMFENIDFTNYIDKIHIKVKYDY